MIHTDPALLNLYDKINRHTFSSKDYTYGELLDSRMILVKGTEVVTKVLWSEVEAQREFGFCFNRSLFSDIPLLSF